PSIETGCVTPLPSTTSTAPSALTIALIAARSSLASTTGRDPAASLRPLALGVSRLTLLPPASFTVICAMSGVLHHQGRKPALRGSRDSGGAVSTDRGRGRGHYDRAGAALRPEAQRIARHGAQLVSLPCERPCLDADARCGSEPVGAKNQQANIALKEIGIEP